MIRAEEIRGGASEPARFSHVLSPKKILDLALHLYGANPRAFVVTVAGEDFGHGDSLSATVASALPELVSRIERLIKESNP
jgi:Ni,Fe-hydrogenase maturation factor